MTIIRSMVTVACWLDTLGCWMTMDDRLGSRPITICPGGTTSIPVAISARVMAGWWRGMGTWPAPIVNWVRRSKAACSPGRRGRPLAVAAPAPQTKTSLPAPRWMSRACSGSTPSPWRTMSQEGKLPTVRFCLPKPGITPSFSAQA